MALGGKDWREWGKTLIATEDSKSELDGPSRDPRELYS